MNCRVQEKHPKPSIKLWNFIRLRSDWWWEGEKKIKDCLPKVKDRFVRREIVQKWDK